MSYKKLIIQKIETICQILNELQYTEMNEIMNVQKNQNEILNKLDKLQEYNEIDDMNNAVIYQRLQNIYEKV